MKHAREDSSSKENKETANFGGKLRNLILESETKSIHPHLQTESTGKGDERKEGLRKYSSNFSALEQNNKPISSSLLGSINHSQSLVNETLNLMTRSQYVQNSIKPHRRIRQSHDIRDQSSLKKKYEDIMHEIKNGVKTGKELRFDLLDNTSVHFSDFKDYESESDPSKLKKIIRDLEIENREKDAEIIKLGMQVKDLSRLITNYIRCQKYGVVGKLNFEGGLSGAKSETPT